MGRRTAGARHKEGARHRNAEHLVKCRACHAVYEWDDYQDNLAPGEERIA